MENIKNTLSNYNTYTCAIKLQRGVKMNLTLYYLQLRLLHHIHNSLTNYLLDRVENCCFEFYAMCWIVAHHLLYLYKSTFSKLSNIIEIQSII